MYRIILTNLFMHATQIFDFSLPTIGCNELSHEGSRSLGWRKGRRALSNLAPVCLPVKLLGPPSPRTPDESSVTRAL